MGNETPDGVYRFDRFALDLGRGALLEDGAERALRPKSFGLLLHLVENAGRLISRDELMQAVWPGVFVTDDSLAQCIREIRRALGDGEQQMLRTLPRRGVLFTAEVSHSASTAALAAVAAAPDTVAADRGDNGAGLPGLPGEDAALSHLCGRYVCYSMAWSPYYRGQIIRGSLLLLRGSRGAPLVATYTEHLLGQTVRFKGDAFRSGRTFHVVVHGPGDGSPLFMSLFFPGPPASALCGVMSGATVVGPEPCPSASRIVIIRVPANPAPSDRYMEPAPGAVAEDLAGAGVPLAEASSADALVRGLLLRNGQGKLQQVAASDQIRLVSVLDKIHLGAR